MFVAPLVRFLMSSLLKEINQTCILGASVWDTLLFSYTTKVVMLGNTAETLNIGDLPIVPADMRATSNYAAMKRAIRGVGLRIGSWSPKPGSGWGLAYRLVKLNTVPLTAELLLASISAILFYTPAIFLQRLVAYLEVDSERTNIRWGWVHVFGLFMANAGTYLGEFFIVAISKLFGINNWYSHRSVVVPSYYYDTSPYSYPAQFYPLCQDTRS